MIECQVLEDNYRYKMKYSPDYQGVDTEAVRVCTASLGGSTIAVQWACVQAAGLQAQHTHEGGEASRTIQKVHAEPSPIRKVASYFKQQFRTACRRQSLHSPDD